MDRKSIEKIVAQKERDARRRKSKEVWQKRCGRCEGLLVLLVQKALVPLLGIVIGYGIFFWMFHFGR